MNDIMHVINKIITIFFTLSSMAAFTQTNNVDNAKTVLNKLVMLESPFKSGAQELLNKL